MLVTVADFSAILHAAFDTLSTRIRDHEYATVVAKHFDRPDDAHRHVMLRRPLVEQRDRVKHLREVIQGSESTAKVSVQLSRVSSGDPKLSG